MAQMTVSDAMKAEVEKFASAKGITNAAAIDKLLNEAFAKRATVLRWAAKKSRAEGAAPPPKRKAPAPTPKATNGAVATGSQLPIEKRPRGRPRKNPLPTPFGVAVSAAPAATAPKRRGRPPKAKPVEETQMGADELPTPV